MNGPRLTLDYGNMMGPRLGGRGGGPPPPGAGGGGRHPPAPPAGALVAAGGGHGEGLGMAAVHQRVTDDRQR
jgi:hypothetical protein